MHSKRGGSKRLQNLDRYLPAVEAPLKAFEVDVFKHAGKKLSTRWIKAMESESEVLLSLPTGTFPIGEEASGPPCIF